MKMKKTIILSVSILLIFLAAGCLSNSEDTFNPLNKNVSEFHTGGIENVPVPMYYPLDENGTPSQKQFMDFYHFIQVNNSMPAYSPEDLPNESDLAFYGTVKEIHPSYWSTPDGQTPENPQQAFHYDNYCIYTDIVFTVTDPAKGNPGDEVVVTFLGGEVDDFVIFFDGPLSPWDFEKQKEGQEYLLYLTVSSIPKEGTYYLMPGGAFFVNE
ncbi:hypothetical protein MsAg5_08400 [Methanosarcinaceae archaeon Ag5]|uniref:Lipoprotein n=1 Tax=Methanolapillus africanus TaxID=3028297 RepID=A0AAE4MJW4_9EURY|nr:hypothetical protein [Methanosarcinaceae archaeon Ag5]